MDAHVTLFKKSERWRVYCEASYLLSKPLKERRKLLDGIEEVRGHEHICYLKGEMERIWKDRKSSK